jgi:Ser/Thr protein kinase RdoA (MazF antagonist)
MTQDVFPVVYSTLAPEALVKQVLSQYQVGTVNKCLLWNRGLADVYIVETKTGLYVLKVSHHHWRSRTEIQFELELLEFLSQRCLPVSYPLKTQDGELFVAINALEGDRYAALYTYASGQVPLGDLNLTQSQVLGETLGKLHQAGADFCPSVKRQPLNLKYLLDDSLLLIFPFLQHRDKDLEYLKNAIAHIKHQLEYLPKETPFWGVCWGDPHSGNVHFTKDNNLTLFDFDQCGYGWRAFDLAKFVQVSLRGGIGRKIRDAFLTGYQSVQPLSKIELESLQALTQTAHIWGWAISINAAIIHSWCRLDDHYFTMWLEQLKLFTSTDWQLF